MSDSFTPSITHESKPPLKEWHYPSSQDVDLEFIDGPKLSKFHYLVISIIVGFMLYLTQTPALLEFIISCVHKINTPFGFFLLVLNLLVLIYVVLNKESPVYLIDFTVYRAPPEHLTTKEWFSNFMRKMNMKEENIQFVERLLQRTGLGDETAFTEEFFKDEPNLNMEAARGELDSILPIVSELFEKTSVKPKDIGILVVNCSLFNPTPSMCSRVINKFKMRTDIQSYNLSGMGCSASVLAVRLVRDLLQIRPNTYALVISTENITQNLYKGSEKGMLVSNSLFRLGAAAMLLSNKSSDRSRARYQLMDTYRAHLAADDEAYQSIYQVYDSEGHRGVRLTPNLLPIVERGLTLNLNYLGQIILPIPEQLKYVLYMIKKKLGYKQKPFTPDFKKAIQHFCIHAGGRGVIDGLEKTLSLSEKDTAASRATLWQFGNTSSSSIWYEFFYIQASGRVKQGDVIWQIALGSGFKCNSALWKALKTVHNKKKPDWI